jgi:hypothetical protein
MLLSSKDANSLHPRQRTLVLPLGSQVTEPCARRRSPRLEPETKHQPLIRSPLFDGSVPRLPGPPNVESDSCDGCWPHGSRLELEELVGLLDAQKAQGVAGESGR